MSRVALPLILLAVATIYGLYRLSYAFEHLQHELGHYNRQIVATRQEIAVLHAEWAYLSRPSEIARLTAQYMTDLKPLTVKQIIAADAIAGLPARLPPAPTPLLPPSQGALSPAEPVASAVDAAPLAATLSGAAQGRVAAHEAGIGGNSGDVTGLRLAERILDVKASSPSLQPARDARAGGAR